MKKIVCLLLATVLVFSFCACSIEKEPISNMETSNTAETSSKMETSSKAETSNTAETSNKTETSSMMETSSSTSTISSSTQSNDTAHSHIFDQKNTNIEYQKSKATTSSPAIYYYSCSCGEKGSSTFTYGTAISSWQQENKTVYCIRKVSLHTTTDDNKNYCENVSVGKSLNVIATDGTWYKVQYTNLPQGYAYIMCKYVTDDKDEATFINYDSNNIKSAVVLDGKIGVYLCNDLSEESSSQVGYITYDQSHQYSFYIEGINQKGDWVKVRYCGYDSKNRYYDGNKLYYCKRNNLWIFD